MGRPALEATRSLGSPTANGSPAMSAGTVVSPVHRVTQCACRLEGLHYIEPIIDTVLPDTPERIYNLMFASSEFLKDFMRLNQKLDDIQILSDWAPSPGNQGCLARTMSYIKPLGGVIGLKSAKCEIRNETVHRDFDDYVATVTTTRTPDVPSGGVFNVKTRTCITWASSASSRVVVTSQVEWTGRSWIRVFIERSAYEGQRSYQRELECAMRIYIQGHQTEFIPPGFDPAAVAVAVQGQSVPTTPTTPSRSAARSEETARKEREQERNQRGLQWAYDTLEGAIELIRDAWDQSSTSTILYFVIPFLVLSNLWTLMLVGRREEAGRRKEMRRTEEREKWMQGIITALLEEPAAGRQPGALPAAGSQAPQSVRLPESRRDEVAELGHSLDAVEELGHSLYAVEERLRLIRQCLQELD
ncbi:hypothetical protein BJV78DRAFT_1360328 [Lactifluus subvellereus]|nr:hypothetical protein BJV78DRAFT_1360328 [Lactifluus subvellereus]